VKAQELSRKYATAVFSQALEKWLGAVRAVNDRLASDSTLADTLEDSSRSFTERQQALDKVIPEGSDKEIRNFFYTMLKDDNIALLPDVLADLDRMVRGGPQVQVAIVTTALSLSDKEKEQFRDKLAKKYDDDLEFLFNVDPSIIGGAIVQVGDKIMDGSVATRLGAMKNVLGVK
jgi:F-type H+-transporting ATPase subunit delta